MSYGFSATNTLGTIQIDELYRNQHVVKQAVGNQNDLYTWKTSGDVTFPAGNNSEQSLILARPSVAGTAGEVGGFISSESSFSVRGRSAFDLACYSSNGAPLNADSSDFGLQVFNPAGVLTFDSRRQYPDITHVFTITSDQSTPRTFSIAGHTAMPWIVVNNLRGYILWDTGGESADEFLVAASVNSTFTELTVRTIRYVSGTPSVAWSDDNIMLAVAKF